MNRAGRYEISGRLGRGGMSTVYKARAPVTGRVVALKILRPRDEIFVDLVGERRLRELFVEEAKIMGGITHDHVAKVIDCDEHEGTPFIVLEYFSHSVGALIGEAYRVEQPSRIVSVQRAQLYLNQALKGLERLHFAGIVHRDIKPYNLMITSDDRVKIIDFGLSRVRGEEKVAIPGMQVGSPFYAAPEQESDPRAADGRADLYSLGVLLYRMLTGRLPEPDVRGRKAASRINPELTGGWDDFLKKALDPEPERRFAGPLEMRLALEQVYEEWKQVSENNCPIAPVAPQSPAAHQGLLRNKPRRVMFKEIREQLALDELLRPLDYFRHQLRVVNPVLLHDPATGLYWQRRGSGFSLDWRQAAEYVCYLNAMHFQGKSTWRLPTTAELVSVLRPPTAHRDFCLSPHFDGAVHWLWSGDHCTKKQAWMADLVESHLDRQDMDGTACVCAVSS